jgi:hypothetical protein
MMYAKMNSLEIIIMQIIISFLEIVPFKVYYSLLLKFIFKDKKESVQISVSVLIRKVQVLKKKLILSVS